MISANERACHKNRTNQNKTKHKELGIMDRWTGTKEQLTFIYMYISMNISHS